MNVTYKGPAFAAVLVPRLVEYWKEHGGKWTSSRNAGIAVWELSDGDYIGMPYKTKSGLIIKVWKNEAKHP